MMGNDHIHRVGDGRGPRDVFVNGNKIDCAVWADTKRGEVVFHPRPARIHKLRRDEVYARMLKGVVTVEFLEARSDG